MDDSNSIRAPTGRGDRGRPGYMLEIVVLHRISQK